MTFQKGDLVRMKPGSDRLDGPSGVVEVLEVGRCDVEGECSGTGHNPEFLRIVNDWVGGEDWMHAHSFEKAA